MGGWLFMILFMGVLATITLGVIESGRPLDGLPAPVGALLILLLWAAGIVGTVLIFQVPVTRLTIVDGWVTAREFWLWKRRETRFSPCKDHLRIIRQTWGVRRLFRCWFGRRRRWRNGGRLGRDFGFRG
jgi:hypothetical protein